MAEGSSSAPPRIAVLIPCLDEEATVADVVKAFADELPRAEIWVFDNGSTDRTAEVARRAGARVRLEPRRGKGRVLDSMLSTVEADVYVLVDGDATYPADRVHDLVAPILAGVADHVVGARRARAGSRAYRRFHAGGNRLVTFLVNRIFGTRLRDVMSGYRAFGRTVADHVPFASQGFEVETELTLQTLEKGFSIQEIDVDYRERPEGSRSKLSTWSDGLRVLTRLAAILKDFRPFGFFSVLGLGAAALSLLCGYLPIADYVRERYVHHVPLAILAAVLAVIAVGLVQTGVVLTTLNARMMELHRLRRRDRRRGPPAAGAP